MPELNLTAKGKEQELILAYLAKNASDALAEKINNGTPFVKDNKQLLNRKTLDDFMTFASEEARKQAEKSARYACVPDDTVFGWAVHYFEEDGIEGTLYNPDGTEYKPPKPKVTTKAVTPAVRSQPQTKPQPSLFDLMQPDKPESKTVSADQEVDDEEPESEEDEQTDNEAATETMQESDAVQQTDKLQPEQQKPNVLPFYQRYTELKSKYPERVIVYRLGDFYEVFGDAAVTLARDFDLTLTGRDCRAEGRVPMIGIPYHAADKYFGKFIERGYKLAVIEHLDTPKLLDEEPELTDAIDPETGEVLTETEMRLFDGDVAEPNEIMPAVNHKAVPDVSAAFDAEALKSFKRVIGNIYVLR